MGTYIFVAKSTVKHQSFITKTMHKNYNSWYYTNK